MTTEALWRLVQTALDERRDPLADEAVLAELEQQPEALAEVTTLVDGLDLLPGAAPVRRASRRQWWLAAACAAGLLPAPQLWTGPSSPPSLQLDPAQAQASVETRRGRSRVLSYRVSVDHSSTRGRTTSTSAGQAGEFTRQARFELQPPVPRPYAPLPLTTVIVCNLTRNQP